MKGVKVACGQITWGRNLPVETVLAEIAQAGYEGAPVSNRDGQSVKQTRELYDRFGLAPAPGYLGLAWWQADQRVALIDQAARLAAFSRELGLNEMYVASNLTPERRLVSGHVSRSDTPSSDEFDRFADLLNMIGRTTRREGVRICFHNHVGSPIETRWEVDQLFARVDRSVVFQGADIGHLAWAGDDVVHFCKDYAASILTLHVKDIDPKVRAEGVAQGWDYQTFSDHGIFAELGEGMVDFPSMFEALRSTDFAGWIVVETDVTQKASALESAQISRQYLRSIGV